VSIYSGLILSVAAAAVSEMDCIQQRITDEPFFRGYKYCGVFGNFWLLSWMLFKNHFLRFPR